MAMVRQICGDKASHNTILFLSNIKAQNRAIGMLA